MNGANVSESQHCYQGYSERNGRALCAIFPLYRLFQILGPSRILSITSFKRQSQPDLIRDDKKSETDLAKYSGNSRGVRLDDRTAAFALGTQFQKTLAINWPADFDMQGMTKSASSKRFAPMLILDAAI